MILLSQTRYEVIYEFVYGDGKLNVVIVQR